jgi:hypothetical protein
MLLTTDLNKRIVLENASNKAKGLCKLYKCDLLELLVMSIDKQAEIKKEQDKNN